MAHKLSSAATFFTRMHPSVVIQNNENGFYQIVGREKYGEITIRKEIFKFQLEHEYYFKLFLPKVENRNGEKSFKHDMEVMNNSRQFPSLREICAASEVIENEIHLILFTYESGNYRFSGIRFVPVLNEFVSSNKKPLVLLMALDGQENPFFVRVNVEAEASNIEFQCISNNRHVRCLDNRFMNSFRHLEDMSLMTHLRYINEHPCTNVCDLLSLIVYGDKKYGENLKSMIFDFQTEEDKIETFVKLFDLNKFCEKDEIANAESSIFWKERSKVKVWEIAIRRRRDEGEFGKSELFATASILNCPIYFREGEDWNFFPPITTNYADIFKSPLLITKGSDNGIYNLLMSFDYDCLCVADLPDVDSPFYRLQVAVQKLIAESQELHISVRVHEIDQSLSLVMKKLDIWNNDVDDLMKLYENLIEIFENRRNRVNKASIAGASSGIVGSVLVFAGLVASPFTVGASLALAVVGGVVGGAGGFTTLGAKSTEIYLTRKELNKLSVRQDSFQKDTLALNNAIESLMKTMNELLNENQSVHVNEAQIALNALPGLLRAVKEATIIPLVVFKMASKGASILSSLLLPVAFGLDIGIIANAIHNNIKGSRTDASTKLRKALVSIRLMKTQMKIWAYGNH